MRRRRDQLGRSAPAARIRKPYAPPALSRIAPGWPSFGSQPLVRPQSNALGGDYPEQLEMGIC